MPTASKPWNWCLAEMHAPDLPADALLTRLQPVWAGNGRVMIGYSGGLDSTVLLHWLAELPVLRGRLHAVHVHHGLSANADLWVDHCTAVCAHLNIPLQVEYVRVCNQGDGVEDAARQARYAAFCRHTEPGDWLLLAQHADDQTETFFMRLLRGAGLDGLAGMPEQRTLHPGVEILRPLLTVSRQTLQHWAEARQLDWINDESNADNRYDRNWWRNELLPQLWRRFPGRQAVFQRSLQQLQQDQQVLQELLQPHLDSCLQPWHWPQCAALALDIPAVQRQPEHLRSYLIRGWLGRLGIRVPSAQWLQRIQTEVIGAADDAQPMLPVGIWQLRRHRSCLYLHAPQALPSPQSIQIGTASRLPVWAGAALVMQTAAAGIAPGDYQLVAAAVCSDQSLTMRGRPSKRMHALFQEFSVPVPLRPCWPVLMHNGELCAVVGIAVDERCCVASGAMVYWQPALA